jgi:uncharacterized RDD family membrane protein YckC
LNSSASQLELAPAWKQEVNQRVAAHMRRKGGSAAEQESPGTTKRGARSAAAGAAARVAARYANAPSYGDLLAGEARAAVRAAEAVSRAALEAQAAAESLLAGLEADTAEAGLLWATESEEGMGPELMVSQSRAVSADAAQTHSQQNDTQPYGIRWAADLPVREASPAPMRASHGAEAQLGAGEAVEMVEPALPMHANLIEFPRELVATRKVRPRLVEGPLAAAPDAPGQLSIFEVDPGSISIEPAVAAAESAAAWPAAEWTMPEWSSIKREERSGDPFELGEDPVVVAAPALEPASMGLRLMATVVDFSLITGALAGTAMAVMQNATDLPGTKAFALTSVWALIAIGVVYQLFFFTLGAATPGMKWAHISLRTLNDEPPSCGQRCCRLAAMLLSLLPVGLGVAWAIFDEEHLSWHDRLSGTYLRKC